MNFKDVKADVWIRLAVLILAMVNQFLTTAGINPIAVSETELYQALTGIVTIATALAAFWKNNSLTASAQQSDIVMKNLKAAAEKTIIDKSTQMLAEHEEAVKAESQVQ